VRAGHAHRRRPRENLHGCGRPPDLAIFRHLFAEQPGNGRTQHVRRQFALQWEDFLADDLDALRLQFGFDQRFDFLDDDDLIDQRCQFAAFLERHRTGEAKLEHRRVREGFLDVHVGRTGSDETDTPVAARFDEIQRRNLGLLAQFAGTGEHQRDALAGAGRRHHPARRILLETARLVSNALTDRDQCLDVVDARGHAQDHRYLEFLRELEGRLGHLVGFLRIGGFEHRQVGKAAPVARVLFILRRRKPHIVSDGDHQAADHAGQRQRHQGIGGDVHADMLHAAERTRAGIGRADRHFQRHFFIDRPLGIEVRVGRDHFEHLGGRCAGVSGRNPDSRLPDGAGDCFVTRHQNPAGGRYGHDCGHDDSSISITKPSIISGDRLWHLIQRKAFPFLCLADRRQP